MACALDGIRCRLAVHRKVGTGSEAFTTDPTFPEYQTWLPSPLSFIERCEMQICTLSTVDVKSGVQYT